MIVLHGVPVQLAACLGVLGEGFGEGKAHGPGYFLGSGAAYIVPAA